MPGSETPPAEKAVTETPPAEKVSTQDLQTYVQLQQQVQTRDALNKQTDAALTTLKQNFAINTVYRFLFYGIAVTVLVIMVRNLGRSFNGFITLMLQAIQPGDPIDRLSRIGGTLIALSLPILYALVIAAVCVGLALLIQNRGIKEFTRSLEQVSRLRREASDSRTRALTQILEETLTNARQAFTLQLWISRGLFLVGVGLLLTFFITLTFDNGILTGTSGIGSVIALVAAALFNPQKQIGSDLANVTQLEAILGGYTRQASVLEEHLYHVMDYHRLSGNPDKANGIVQDGINQLSKILTTAVNTIEDKVEAGDRMNSREKWLWDQLIDRDAGRTATLDGDISKSRSTS